MIAELLGEHWNISRKGEEIITENNEVRDKGTVLNNALNSDLKEIGSPVLNKIQNKNKLSQVVLQIQKIRNISAPKANENSQVAPRMLKLVLTDGDSYIQAIETTPIASIYLEKTPPGSKLLIYCAQIVSGYILLNSNNCSLLGGLVPALYEKWELAKSVKHYMRTTSTDGPPAWVNFGRKILSNAQDTSFKSLENKSSEFKENSKFDIQRQDAIAEATSGAVRKVFGGGLKLPLQAPPTPKSKNFPIKDKRNKNKPNANKQIDDKPQKPLENISLFDFLEDKLPTNEIETPKSVPSNANNNNNNNNNNNLRNCHIDLENNRNRNTHKTNELYNPHKSDLESSTRSTVLLKNEPNVGVNGLNQSFAKLSLNSQFASRSLKQHLNLGPQKNTEKSCGTTAWKVGDDCLAKYWEDGKFYNAVVTAVTDTTCVVKFKGYRNIEEVLKNDCLPVTSNETKKSQYTGPIEIRRSARTYRRQ